MVFERFKKKSRKVAENPAFAVNQHIYQRFERIDCNKEPYLGNEGTLNFIYMAEKDEGLMGLVSHEGDVNIQRDDDASGLVYLVLNPNGFYICEHGIHNNYRFTHDRPTYEDKPVERTILRQSKDRPSFSSITVRNGLLDFIRGTRNISHGKKDLLAPEIKSRYVSPKIYPSADPEIFKWCLEHCPNKIAGIPEKQ